MPTGNKVAFASGGEDAIKLFTQITSGTVYYSYLLNVTDLATAPSGYVAGLLPNAVATSTTAPGTGSIAGTVWVKASANAGFFNIGLSARANQSTIGTGATNLQYGTVDYPVNTPVLIVASYEIVAGSANDICNLWVNPVPGSAAPAYTFTTTPSTDIADVSGFFIRQNGSSSTPGVEMDELRIGLNWADVTPGLPVTPTLIADATANTVDNNIDITFTDNAVWRTAVTDVKIDATSLTAGTDYELTAGNLTLKPSGLNVLLTTAGSKEVAVIATGFDDAVLTQEIYAGVPTSNSTVSINNPLLPGLLSSVTCTAKDQYNNLVSGYMFKYDVSVTNATLVTTETYLIDGNPLATTTNDISVTAVTDLDGIATFTAVLPVLIDGDDGVAIQVQLNDGITNVGSALEFSQLTSQTITFNPLSVVNYGDADFTLSATASSGLAVSYVSSNPLVATVTAEGVVTIVGVGTTTITASQAGNSEFNAALNVSHDLFVGCAQASAVLTGTTTACSGEEVNIQVAITAIETQLYTLVYTDGATNFTISDYSSGTTISVTPTSTTTYSLVSVIGANANICEAAYSGSAVVTVIVTPAPTGNAEQVFTTNEPVLISDLEVTGSAVVWYSSSEDALAGNNVLASDFQVTSGNIYYAMQMVDGCVSVAPLAVTVTTILGNDVFEMQGLKYYPNPVTSVLNISYSELITDVTIFNSLGQSVLSVQPNGLNAEIDLNQLPSSTYFAEIESNGTTKLVKLLKI